MATKADLRRLILTFMTVIDETENPSPEQASLLNIFIDSARGVLLEKGLCWWDEDDIPASVLLPLRKFVASLCCGDFGRAGKGYEEGQAAAYVSLASLKSSDQREVVQGEYS